MIGALSDAMRVALRARGIPAIVSYGEHRLDRVMPQPGAVEIDFDEGTDVYADAITARGQASAVGTMSAVSTASIVVRVASSKSGAMHRDHRELGRAVVHTLLLEMRAWANKRGCSLAGATGGFVDPVDSPQQHGATYELAADFGVGIQIPSVVELDGLIADGEALALTGEGEVTIQTGDVIGVVCTDAAAPAEEDED